ncbi:MAG TPA: hypothetical protein VKR32_06180 [Puia sp.]|nr:hypothetical protein [Puia sp.]
MKFRWILIFVSIACGRCIAQSDPNLQKLRSFSLKYVPRGYDSTLSFISYAPGGNLNYLFPLYQFFKQPVKFHSLLGIAFYDRLSEAVSFVEDYHSSLEIEEKSYEPVEDATQITIQKTVAEFRGIQHVDARRYISFLAKQFRVIMLNESPSKPVHRAFAISLLEDLRNKGFKYLAMEMLNNFAGRARGRLDAGSGDFTAEPIAGELVRRALELGFTLVPYEDTLGLSGQHDARQRDSVQAENIFSIIKGDSAAKIFVYASYGHIAKSAADSSFRPMALVFRQISGIDPLTIDQTAMTEGSNFAYGDALYKSYTEKYYLSSPSIAMINGDAVNICNDKSVDISVIHPPTVYRDGRPEWLSLNGLRKPILINPHTKDAFLIQAYYQREADLEGPGKIVPADQSYIPTPSGSYLLYLRPGRYTIIYRSLGYHLIGKLKINVE